MDLTRFTDHQLDELLDWLHRPADMIDAVRTEIAERDRLRELRNVEIPRSGAPARGEPMRVPFCSCERILEYAGRFNEFTPCENCNHPDVVAARARRHDDNESSAGTAVHRQDAVQEQGGGEAWHPPDEVDPDR